MNKPTETSQAPLLGIALKVASIVLLVTMMVSLKFATEHIAVGQIIFTRAVIGIATIYTFYYVVAHHRGSSAGFKIKSAVNHLPWAISSAFAMTMWFVALTLIPLPEATAIGFLLPLLVVFFAWLILGERIKIIRSLAIATGLLGVSIIVWPRLGTDADYGSASALGAALSLAAVVCWAYAQICLRTLSKTESSGSAVISFSVATMSLAILTIPLSTIYPQFSWMWPDSSGWLWLLLCGVTGGLGQLGTAESLRYATPGTLAPFEYLAFPVASIAAIFFFDEHPDANIWKGLPFVIAGGSVVILREYQLKIKADRNSSKAPR